MSSFHSSGRARTNSCIKRTHSGSSATPFASSVPNVYILEGGVNNWIAFFGKDDKTLQPAPNAGDDQLGYVFPAALGNRYESCSPNPIEYEKLEFEAKIVLQLKRDKSGGGCG